jgi:hypothetical protein
MTISERIGEMSVINEIDEMLSDGISCGDVAKLIQLGHEEMVDVKTKCLSNALAKRRHSVLGLRPKVPIDDRMASIIPTEGRRPGMLSRNQYISAHKMMDRLIELEALYLAQRDRIDSLIEKEKELGYPFEMTDRSMLTAAKLLELHGKLEKDLLDRIGGGPSDEKLDLKGYSEETARVLQKPDSRRRVVSIIERLKRVKGGVEIPELEMKDR